MPTTRRQAASAKSSGAQTKPTTTPAKKKQKKPQDAKEAKAAAGGGLSTGRIIVRIVAVLAGMVVVLPKPGNPPEALPAHCHEGRKLEPFAAPPKGWDAVRRTSDGDGGEQPPHSLSSSSSSSSSSTLSKFDVVVFGATGFTGRHVARYLAKLSHAANKRHYGPQRRAPASSSSSSSSSASPDATTRAPFTFALAGRSIGKLAALREELEREFPHAGTFVDGAVGGVESPSVRGGSGAYSIGVVVADSHDAQALSLLARRARAVVTTAGPYTEHGSELVAACAAQGTHYADLSGEPFWQRTMIDEHDAVARRTGAKVVLASGYDSIPFDLGYLFAAEAFKAKHGGGGGGSRVQHPTDVTAVVEVSRGWLSGGTLASAVMTVREILFGTIALSEAADPYLLVPPPHAATVAGLRRRENEDEAGGGGAVLARALDGYDDYDAAFDDPDEDELEQDEDLRGVGEPLPSDTDFGNNGNDAHGSSSSFSSKLATFSRDFQRAVRRLRRAATRKRRPAKPSELACRSDTELSGWGNRPRYDATLAAARHEQQQGEGIAGIVSGLGVLGIPHFMAAINARVVRRSMALLGHRNCSYAEGISAGALLDVAGFMGSRIFGGDMPLEALLPHRGVGPSPSVMRDGSGRVRFVASSSSSSSSSSSPSSSSERLEVATIVEYAGDPGYNATSKMLAEAGLCLADPNCHGSAPGGPGGGVTTPAVAMGMGLVRRLQEAEGGRFMQFRTVTE